MILSMTEQARLFLVLVAAGMAAGLVYDFVRVLRRLVRHSLFMIQAEDLIYWLVFTVFIMMILLWENNGELRVFSVVAPVLGMIIYFGALSEFFLVPATALTLFIKKLILAVLHIFCIPLVFFGKLCAIPINLLKKRLYIFNKFIKKVLKKFIKYERMIKEFCLSGLYGFIKGNGSERVEGRSQKKEKK